MSRGREARAEDTPMSRSAIWCLIAYVTQDPHPVGRDNAPTYGTKHFPPGAKVYCFRSKWGDGIERIEVLGCPHDRPSKPVKVVMSTKWLVDWQVEQTRWPAIVRAMRHPAALGWDGSDASRLEAERIAVVMNARVAERKSRDRGGVLTDP